MADSDEISEKTFGPEKATIMDTYRYMKVGHKKYRESGSNVSIDNLKSKNRLDAYMTGLKAAYPEDWADRDLDPAQLYLENRRKKDRGYFRVLFSNAGLDVPEDLEDESMENGDHVSVTKAYLSFVI